MFAASSPTGHAASRITDAGDTVAVPGTKVRAHRTLGNDPEAWTVAAHLLPDFVGTLPELLATVDTVTPVTR